MTTTARSPKPLGGKCYGSIPHLPGSRIGPGEHHCHAGQERICTVKMRDKRDRVIVQEKLDGSNVGVWRQGDTIVPLTRAGYLANTSPYEQHHLFWDWAHARRETFLEVLQDGERLCGEWLAQAHATRYDINCLFQPFHAFDIMRGQERVDWDTFVERICGMRNPFCSAKLIGNGPMTPQEALEKDCNPWRKDAAEGVVYRVERYDLNAKRWRVDFLAKYVRPDKKDGVYLPEVSGQPAVWNWRP